MSFRSCVITIGLFVLLFIASAGGGLGLAQQDANNQDQQIMTPVSGPSGSAVEQPTDLRKVLVDRLDLKRYEAAAGDLSSCVDDKRCLKLAKRIKFWVCANAICDGTDKSKKLIDCFGGGSNKYSQKDQDQIASSMCAVIESSSPVTRQALLRHLSDSNTTEDDLVEYAAYPLALGSAVSCEDYIKNYVGAYGSQWTSQWYKAMSGCRILAHERTREQEEKDFYTWFGVEQGLGNCSDIVNSEMRKACSAPGAASPAPSFPQSPVNAQ